MPVHGPASGQLLISRLNALFAILLEASSTMAGALEDVLEAYKRQTLTVPSPSWSALRE
jgi:hypothetical protein